MLVKAEKAKISSNNDGFLFIDDFLYMILV